MPAYKIMIPDEFLGDILQLHSIHTHHELLREFGCCVTAPLVYARSGQLKSNRTRHITLADVEKAAVFVENSGLPREQVTRKGWPWCGFFLPSLVHAQTPLIWLEGHSKPDLDYSDVSRSSLSTSLSIITLCQGPKHRLNDFLYLL